MLNMQNYASPIDCLKQKEFIIDRGIPEAFYRKHTLNEPRHGISNNKVCVTSKASDQPAHMRSLIRAYASRLSIQ